MGSARYRPETGCSHSDRPAVTFLLPPPPPHITFTLQEDMCIDPGAVVAGARCIGDPARSKLSCAFPQQQAFKHHTQFIATSTTASLTAQAAPGAHPACWQQCRTWGTCPPPPGSPGRAGRCRACGSWGTHTSPAASCACLQAHRGTSSLSLEQPAVTAWLLRYTVCARSTARPNTSLTLAHSRRCITPHLWQCRRG